MRNTLKHLTLLTRMKDDGLLPALTGSFSEDAMAQACGQVETLQLQERLHIRKTKRIQEELVRVSDFAALYGALCRQEIGDEEIASVLESADGYGERLTAYPQEQVLAVMKLELLPSLRFEYLKYYFPFVMYEEEEQVILDNLQTLERTDWKQVRKDILTTDADWLVLKEKLAFSDDFVEQNRETVTEFLLQGGAAMVRALYGELDRQELAVEALRRIVQAELMGQFYKLKYFAGDLQREIRYPVSEMQESLWKKNLSLARGAFGAEEVDDFYHTLRLGELPHSTCLSYRTGSQRECLLAAFDSNKKIVLVKKDEAVVARACLRLTKGAFQKPPAVDFSFADLSQENTEVGKSAADEKAVLFLESIYTFGLNDVEKEEVMKLAVSLTTQKAAELGVVAVLARRYLGCYERDEYVLAPFYVYISKSKNGWQYLDSLGGAAYTSAKEEYVERPFLVMQTAMHQAEVNSRNEVEYE